MLPISFPFLLHEQLPELPYTRFHAGIKVRHLKSDVAKIIIKKTWARSSNIFISIDYLTSEINRNNQQQNNDDNAIVLKEKRAKNTFPNITHFRFVRSSV